MPIRNSSMRRSVCLCESKLGPTGCVSAKHECICFPIGTDDTELYSRKSYSLEACRATEHRCSCRECGVSVCKAQTHNCLCLWPGANPKSCLADPDVHACCCFSLSIATLTCRSKKHNCVCRRKDSTECRAQQSGHVCSCKKNSPSQCVSAKRVHQCSCTTSDLCKADQHDCKCSRDAVKCRADEGYHHCQCRRVHPKFCRARICTFCRCGDLGAQECRKDDTDEHACCCTMGYFWRCMSRWHDCVCLKNPGCCQRPDHAKRFGATSRSRSISRSRSRSRSPSPDWCPSSWVGGKCTCRLRGDPGKHAKRMVLLLGDELDKCVKKSPADIVLDLLYAE